MICTPCKEGRPEECANFVTRNEDGNLVPRVLEPGVTPTWCDSQHRETRQVIGDHGLIYTAPKGVTRVVTNQ